MCESDVLAAVALTDAADAEVRVERKRDSCRTFFGGCSKDSIQGSVKGSSRTSFKGCICYDDCYSDYGYDYY